MTDDSCDILPETTFEGELTVAEEKSPIIFRVSIGEDCRLVFDVDPISAEVYIQVAKTQAGLGAKVQEFSIGGTSVDGKTIHSDRVSLGAHGSSSDGHRISISARVATLTMPMEQPISKPVLRLWFRAFKAFRNPEIDTKLGRLEVRGQVNHVGADDWSGCVALQSHTDDPGAKWRENADAFLCHMHQGLAFAHGGRLQTPRLDYIHGSVWESTFYDGQGFASELSVHHPLAQGPFIEALVARYEADGPLSDILWTAVGWMQIETTFDEVRFLTAMTALETIVENELPDLRGTIIPKADYKIVRERLKTVIIEDDTLSEETTEILCGKMDQSNKKTLSQKIDALFDHYDVPRENFENNVIRDLIRLRNDIVHMGILPDETDIWPKIILVRELIALIIMQEIGFVGRYECYVGGHQMKDFSAQPKLSEFTAP